MEFKEQIQRILENVPKVYDAGVKSISSIIEQTTGDSETAVMSQKATTDEIAKVSKRLESLEYVAKGALYKDVEVKGVGKEVQI